MIINGKKKVIFFDIDNTIVNGYTQKKLIIYLYKNGYIHFMSLPLVFFWFFLYKIGVIKNIEFGLKYLASIFAGWNDCEVYSLMNKFFFAEIKNDLFQDAILLINKYKQQGDIIVLISNVIHPIAEQFCRFLHIDFYISTVLDIKNNVYSGELKSVVLNGGDKMLAAGKFLHNNFRFKHRPLVHVYSDHYSDFELLNWADIPIVVNPKKKMLSVSINRKWRILNFT
ncbi:haloacid dehalogenase-like hydrolase [Candidatus Nomurabacteria bacterium]|nr:haloacid dehalogenase-like hydrolase [Candidatus Nomurabacteria bacterium]